MRYVATGQIWKQLGDSGTWRITAVSDDGLVALTGPGPARSVLYVSVDELLTLWELMD